MGSWRLFQVLPSGDAREQSGGYRVDAGRLLLTERSDPECLIIARAMLASHPWSRVVV